jgi:stearoyl-CoA desaturase (delta-9 desaturase)
VAAAVAATAAAGEQHRMTTLDTPSVAGGTTPPAADSVLDPKLDHEINGYAGLPLRSRIANLIAILLPVVGLIVGIVYMWGNGVDWPQLVLMTLMYILTGMGITVGYHRYFTHKSFSAGPVVVAALGILGSMAVEGSILRWCATHRKHHQHSDSEDDPHSPHGHGDGIRAMLKGFWTAHMGWIFHPPGDPLDRYVPDLIRDNLIRRISGLFPLWVALSLVIPTLLGGLLEIALGGGFLRGAFLGFIWGGLVRVLVVHHITWSVNSICHLWGSRPFRSGDHSRNNVIVGVLALGEGWHNNHHAFPTSARHGLEWWQFDSSWIAIRTMERLGLVRDVRVPAAERIEAKRRDRESRPVGESSGD